MERKTNYPDSDESVRGAHPDAADDDPMQDVEAAYPGSQTSTKSGKHSAVEKLAASRPEFGSGRATQPVPGAFGHDEQTHPPGRNAGPGTNQYRCKTCGRFFNTQVELSEHAIECRAAKAAMSATRDQGDQ